MSLAIYVLERSIIDFAGTVLAVSPDGSGITFDAPHIHPNMDPEVEMGRQREKRVFLLGGTGEFAETLAEIRAILASIGVPIVSARPIVNSDGILVHRHIVYDDERIDILVPKVLAGITVDEARSLRCGRGTHVASGSLAYEHCPIDGTPFIPAPGNEVLGAILGPKARISEVRVEEPGARKTCHAHPDRRYPNAFIRCPACAEPLMLARGQGA